MARTCFAQTEQEFRPIQHLRLNGALVFGQGAVATRTNRLVRETVLEFLASGWVPDGLTRCDDGRYRLQSAPTAATARPTLLLKRPWYRNYGHWLVDGATIAALAPSFVLPPNWQVAIGKLDHGRLRDVVYETLEALLPGIPVIELADNETWVFSDSIASPPSMFRRCSSCRSRSQGFARSSWATR